jgi:hypothetical protein
MGKKPSYTNGTFCWQMNCEINRADYKAICEFDTFVVALKLLRTLPIEEFLERMRNWLYSNIVDFTTRGILFAVRPDLIVELQEEFESGQWRVVIRKKHTCVKNPAILCTCFWQKKHFDRIEKFLGYMKVKKMLLIAYRPQDLDSFLYSL